MYVSDVFLCDACVWHTIYACIRFLCGGCMYEIVRCMYISDVSLCNAYILGRRRFNDKWLRLPECFGLSHSFSWFSVVEWDGNYIRNPDSRNFTHPELLHERAAPDTFESIANTTNCLTTLLSFVKWGIRWVYPQLGRLRSSGLRDSFLGPR